MDLPRGRWAVMMCWMSGYSCDVGLLLINLFILNLFIYLFIYLWLHWVFIAGHRLSLVAASGGYSLLRCAGLCGGFSCCGAWAVERRLSSCGAWA